MKTLTKKQAAAPAESIANDAPKLHEVFEVGEAAHQGDLIIVRIASVPKSARPRKDRQLALGNTQGSRHILERGEVFDADAAEVSRMIEQATGKTITADYIGPVFVSPDAPTENDLTHPEHGNHGFPAGAVCAVVYQRNFDTERQREVVARD